MRFSPEAFQQGGQPPSPQPQGHSHFWERALSRRTVLVTGTGGVVAAAAAISTGHWLSGLAKAGGPVPAAPKPIPETIPGTPFHILFPGQGEPLSITDFNGAFGIAHIQGTGTGRDSQTGMSESLLFDADMRFMQGEYVGVDGRHYHSTFGFVWLDLFRGQYDFNTFSTQVHDFNPGIHPFPSGLFWTVPLPDNNIAANPGAGRATWTTSDLALTDFIIIPNSLNNGTLMPTSPGIVSFEMGWSGLTGRTEVHDETLQVAGLVVTTGASIQWNGRNATGFEFHSDPDGQTALFAQVGQERNGVFFS